MELRRCAQSIRALQLKPFAAIEVPDYGATFYAAVVNSLARDWGRFRTAIRFVMFEYVIFVDRADFFRVIPSQIQI